MFNQLRLLDNGKGCLNQNRKVKTSLVYTRSGTGFGGQRLYLKEVEYWNKYEAFFALIYFKRNSRRRRKNGGVV